MPRNLRPLVAEVEQRLAAVSDGASPDGATRALQTAWNALVVGMDLPEEPELRACPACGGQIRRAATLCKHCWSEVVPVPA